MALPEWLPKTMSAAVEYYRDAMSVECTAEELKGIERRLVLGDLFYLLVYVCKRHDMLHPWLFDRIREVQSAPDGYLDLWARDHRKSSIISFGKTIQDILADPEITVNIFSHVRPIAKSFLGQIKNEFEMNAHLKYLFDDVLYENPQRDAKTWSLDSGLVVKRSSNPKEPTIGASGLVDGQPTGMHFKLRVYDDVVTPASVTSADMMQKTLDALDMSDNLGTAGGKVRMIGTRYALGDAYEEYEKRGIVKVRKYPATDDGTVNGNPVLMTQEAWEDKLLHQSAAIISSQMLQNPMSSSSTIFDPDWFVLWPAEKELPAFDMVFQSIDGAFSEKTSADDSVIMTFGLFKAVEGASKYSAMILDCYAEKVNYPTLRDEAIRQYGNKYGKNDKMVDGIIIEDKASGSALIPDLRRADITVYPYQPGGLDKVARANLVSHLVRDGYLVIPESKNRRGYCMSWLSRWWEQMCYFPNVKNDDMVDTTTQFLAVVDKIGFLRGRCAEPKHESYWRKMLRGDYSGGVVNSGNGY